MVEVMIWLLAVPVLASCALVAVTGLVAYFNREPLLRRELPWGCSVCDGAWTDLAAFYGHECQVVAK